MGTVPKEEEGCAYPIKILQNFYILELEYVILTLK